MTADVLTARALGRATLARQLLLARADLSVADVLERLVGMQAQAPEAPYFGLWARLARFAPDDLAGLLADRGAVRIVLMRSTIHLVTAADCRWLRPVLQPVQDRLLEGGYGPALAGVDLAAVADAGRALVEAEPLTLQDVGARLAERWPDTDPSALGIAVRGRVPLVQVPPRGLWGRGGQARHTSAEAWLGGPLDPDPDPERLVLRHLAAFGPATAGDVQKWSGLTGLAEVVGRLRSRLRTFRDDAGRELFDLPDAPRPDPGVPVPTTYLGPFDSMLMSYVDGSRIVDPAHRSRIMTVNGLFPGTVLLDGRVRGQWRLDRRRAKGTTNARLTITPFDGLNADEEAALAEEGARLLAFAAPGGDHSFEVKAG